MRWRRRRDEAAEGEVAGAPAGVPEAEPAEDAPPDEAGRSGRARGLVVLTLVGALVVAALGLVRVSGRSGSPVDVGPGALLVPPRGHEADPTPTTATDSRDAPTPQPPRTPDARVPAPPPPPTEAAEVRPRDRAGATSLSRLVGAPPPAAGFAEEAMAMSYAVSLAERQAMLAELRARQEKAGAEARQAEARARESEIWVRAIERNPTLILQGRLAQSGGRLDGPAGDLLGRMPSAASGPQVGAASPRPGSPPAEKAVEKAGPAAPSPSIDTFRVYLVDRSSAAAPEAVVGVGRTVVSVRPGDRLGDWTVAAITDGAVEVRAPTGQAWRLAVTSAGRGPASARSARSPGESGAATDPPDAESAGATAHGHPGLPVPLARPGQAPGPPGVMPRGSPAWPRSAPVTR
jgi:hypothetical protein